MSDKTNTIKVGIFFVLIMTAGLAWLAFVDSMTGGGTVEQALDDARICKATCVEAVTVLNRNYDLKENADQFCGEFCDYNPRKVK